jgi:undecaprenyl-diphosphatase
MHSGIDGIDGVISRLGRHHPPHLAGRLLAKSASPWAAAVQGLAAAAALRAEGRPWLLVALSAPSATVGAKALKKLTGRRRPGFARFERKGDESFPSSHVAGHAAVLAALSQVAPRSTAWRAVLALACGSSLAIAVERVCAGRHWPSDVLAGAALGIGVGVAFGRLARRTGPVRDEVR